MAENWLFFEVFKGFYINYGDIWSGQGGFSILIVILSLLGCLVTVWVIKIKKKGNRDMISRCHGQKSALFRVFSRVFT